jgi:ferredoxin-NADP reductase
VPAFTTTLQRREMAAEGTIALRLERPEGFSFAAGQSINLTLVDPPHTDARGNMRTFSLASAPFESTLQVATRVRETAFKRVLAGLEPGATLKLRGPGGKFVLPEDELRPVVLVAGGIGVTPFMSMLRQAAHGRSPRPRVLLYSNRRPADAPFLDELLALHAAGDGFRLVATMTGLDAAERSWDGERGKIDAAMMRRHGVDAAAALCYLAGPPGLIAALRPALVEAGAAAADIRTDEFFGY